jgi:hypothetical protein
MLASYDDGKKKDAIYFDTKTTILLLHMKKNFVASGILSKRECKVLRKKFW